MAVLTKLGEMFRNSWTGGVSGTGKPGRYHSKGEWDRFEFKDLFDNSKWTREQRLDTQGNPVFDRNGDPVYTNYYTPGPDPSNPRYEGGGEFDGRGGRPGDDRGIGDYKIPPNRRKGNHHPYTPVSADGKGGRPTTRYNTPWEEVGGDAKGLNRPPVHIVGDANVAEGNYRPIQGPPEFEPEYYGQEGQQRHSTYAADPEMVELFEKIRAQNDANARADHWGYEWVPGPNGTWHQRPVKIDPKTGKRLGLAEGRSVLERAQEYHRNDGRQQRPPGQHHWRSLPRNYDEPPVEKEQPSYPGVDFAGPSGIRIPSPLPVANAAGGVQSKSAFTDQYGNNWPNDFKNNPEYDEGQVQRVHMAGEQKIAPTRNYLKSEEGYKRMPYIDPISGEWHVGHGHKISEDAAQKIVASGGWDKQTAESFLDSDIRNARIGADKLFRQNGISPDTMPPKFREAISNMVFQMGATGVARFEKMWTAIRNGDWPGALREMKESAWAKSQTPERAGHIIAMARQALAVGGS